MTADVIEIAARRGRGGPPDSIEAKSIEIARTIAAIERELHLGLDLHARIVVERELDALADRLTGRCEWCPE